AHPPPPSPPPSAGAAAAPHGPEHTRARSAHDCAQYQDREKGKWVRVEGWAGAAEARAEIESCVRRYAEAKIKPAF
ncbi:MAG: hypothetical protein ACK5SH_17280, partial [Pseudomonadota bacterium]